MYFFIQSLEYTHHLNFFYILRIPHKKRKHVDNQFPSFSSGLSRPFRYIAPESELGISKPNSKSENSFLQQATQGQHRSYSRCSRGSRAMCMLRTQSQPQWSARGSTWYSVTSSVFLVWDLGCDFDYYTGSCLAFFFFGLLSSKSANQISVACNI